MKTEQMSLFSEQFPVPEHIRNVNEWARRQTMLTEELRVGNWDYDRLLPDRKMYEERVKRWRGVSSFNFPQNRFEAIEARNVIRFLNSWKSRADNLTRDIEECVRAINAALGE